MQGLFCVIEGIDGSGKSTLHRALQSLAWDIPVLFTREPTDGPFGQKIRQSLARDHEQKYWIELFMADRAWNMAEKVQPALTRGALVIQDRSFFSTAAYQGDGNLSAAEIVAESRKRFPEPELVLFLEIDPERAMERTGLRSNRDSFERNDQFLREVNDRYKTVLPAGTIRLDATLPAADLQRQVQRIIVERWQEKQKRDHEDIHTQRR